MIEPNLYRCYAGTEEGDECDRLDGDEEDDDEEFSNEDGSIFQRVRRALPDLGAREVVSQLKSVVPCRRGLTCKREALDRRVCRPENQNGNW